MVAPRGRRPPARRRSLLPPHARPRRRCALVPAATSAACTRLELVFHNAYGPDKPWFLDRAPLRRRLPDRSRHPPDRPGAVADRAAAARAVRAATLRRRGRAGEPRPTVEDFAVGRARARRRGDRARLACSWFLPAGRDCVIECTLYGTDGRGRRAQRRRLVLRLRGRALHAARRTRAAGEPARRLGRPGARWPGRSASPRAAASTRVGEEFVTVAACSTRSTRRR